MPGLDTHVGFTRCGQIKRCVDLHVRHHNGLPVLRVFCPRYDEKEYWALKR
jgi:hypothetical protein